MKTKTPKTKNKTARPIPPPPPGWEIVGKDDPRLKRLPCRPLVIAHTIEGDAWEESGFGLGEAIEDDDLNFLSYALPIAQPQSPTPMIRLRLPSEKPTREDGDADGNIFLIYTTATGEKDSVKWFWKDAFTGRELAWFSLPEGILPREPSQEEKWRAEFEQEWPNAPFVYDHNLKEDMWHFFLAAKKGGAE